MATNDDEQSSEPNDDPDENWKGYAEKNIPIEAFYLTQKELLRFVFFSSNRAGELESLINDFKPANYSRKEWVNHCYNIGIDEWINSDSVFLSLYDKKPLSKLQRQLYTYRSMIHEAMQEGVWKKEYSSLLAEFLPDSNQGSDD